MGRRQVGPLDVIAVLTERALVEIRWMAETGEVYVEDERLDPDSPSDVDALARMHLVADVTHGFANVLRMGAVRRGHAARDALRWRWSATSGSGRRWMASRLALTSPRHVAALRAVVGEVADTADVDTLPRTPTHAGGTGLIRATDVDFRVCRIDVETLVRLQESAERRGWATRWSSVGALRAQVAGERVLLQTFQRQRAADGSAVVRCLLLFGALGDDVAGGVATLDVDPHDVQLLPRADVGPAVRSAMADVFVLATGGIAMMTKQ